MPPAPVAKADRRVDLSPADECFPAPYAPFLLQAIIANSGALIIAVIPAKGSPAFYAFYNNGHVRIILFYHLPEKRPAHNRTDNGADNHTG